MTTPNQKTVEESSVIALHRPSGELTFTHDGTVKPDDVVTYQGKGFIVQDVIDDDGDLWARAFPMRIEDLGDVEPFILRLEPGDVIVISSKVKLTSEQMQLIVDGVKAIVPGYETIVLDEELTIGKITVPTSGQEPSA